MDLSIIIVSYKVKDKLKENLKAIYNSRRGFSFEIIVVDNNSQDGSGKMVKHMFPGVNIISNQENLGFARACNQGIKTAKGEFMLLLNPDMQVQPDTLKKMLEWMKTNTQATVTSCKLQDVDNNILDNPRRFPTVWNQLAIILKLPHLFPQLLNKYLYKDKDKTRILSVDSVKGAFFMMRKKAFDKLPLLDERYFIWFEEVDFCKQVRETGGKIFYVPIVSCIDYVGSSFKQLPQLKTQKLFRDSMLAYFKKWHSPVEYKILKGAWKIGYILSLVFSKFKTKIKT